MRNVFKRNASVCFRCLFEKQITATRSKKNYVFFDKVFFYFCFYEVRKDAGGFIVFQMRACSKYA